MSFKISRRTKQVLASLLITANFVNNHSNVKSMEKGMRKLDKIKWENIWEKFTNYQCITDDFILEVINNYIKYKNYDNNYLNEINKNFNSNFNWLNDNVFNKKLIHDFRTDNNGDVIDFHPNVMLSTMKTFFQKNIHITNIFKSIYDEYNKYFLIFDYKQTTSACPLKFNNSRNRLEEFFLNKKLSFELPPEPGPSDNYIGAFGASLTFDNYSVLSIWVQSLISMQSAMSMR